MWIKRSLVILPIVLFAFLAQSVFWVPGTASVSNNESRQNRVILYMGGNPEDMNPWTSASSTDSTISDYFFEGLVRYNRMYELEPWLAESIVVAHEVDLLIPAGVEAKAFETSIREQFDTKLESVKEGPTLEVRLSPEIKEQLKEAPVLPALEQIAARGGKYPTLTVTFSTPPVKGEIVSAVQPDAQKLIEERLGVELLRSHLGTLEEEFSKIPEASRTGNNLTIEAFRRHVEEALSQAGLRAAAHRPVVDCHLHKGVFWTDGPFFANPTSVWMVSVDGDAAGTIVADSQGEAEQTIRTRLGAKPNANVEARRYDHRFGEENGGPWWGRGPELTSRDVKLTYEHVKNPDFGSPRYSSYTSIVDIRTSDDDAYRVKVVYDELYSPALSDLTGSILPYHRWNSTAWTEEAVRRGLGPADLGIPPDKYNPVRALRSKDRSFGLAPSYLGSMLLDPMNGESVPYWKNNLRIRLRRNEFYWNRKPEYEYIDWFVFDPALGSETAEVVFLGGGMDVYSAKEYQVPRYEAMDDRYYVIKRQPVNYEYYGFNMAREHLKDKRVRLALSMAINVEEIIKYVVFEQGSRISGPAYPVMPWYNRDYLIEYQWRSGPKKGQTEKLQFLPFDMEEAKALLSEAGYREQGGKLFKDGQPLKLQFVNTTGQGPRQNSAKLAKERWEQLGIEVDYKEYEWNDYIQRFVKAGNFDVYVLGWTGGLDFDSRQLWHSTAKPPNGLNFVSYANPKADELMEKILQVYDPAEQLRLSHQIFDTIAADVPYIFLYSPYTTTVVDRHIVWRKQVGVDAEGKPVYEDRPLDHEYIKNARATWRYFEPELIRREQVPEFSEADRKD